MISLQNLWIGYTTIVKTHGTINSDHLAVGNQPYSLIPFAQTPTNKWNDNLHGKRNLLRKCKARRMGIDASLKFVKWKHVASILCHIRYVSISGFQKPRRLWLNLYALYQTYSIIVFSVVNLMYPYTWIDPCGILGFRAMGLMITFSVPKLDASQLRCAHYQ